MDRRNAAETVLVRKVEERVGFQRGCRAAATPAMALLLTAGIWLMAMALFGVYPFGDRSILITDLSQQYVEFHAALYDAVKDGDSLFFTWNTGLGMNFLGVFAYYLASPFTAVMLAFPRAMLTEAILCIVTLKLAGAACTMSVFLRRGAGCRGVGNALFAAMYGLSGYALSFFYNLMWLDAVLLLPLLMLAVGRVAAGRGFAPLAAVFAVCFVTNFYTGYILGAFSLLALLALLWRQGSSRRNAGRALGRLFAAAGIAAGLGAALLLPTALALGDSQDGAGLTLPWLSLMTDPLTLIGKTAVGAYDSVTSAGSPNLYAGVLTIGLLPGFLLHPGISRREKQAFAALSGALLLCMLLAPLDTLWHAGQPPVWFPCRYSFCLIFLMIAAAARILSLPGNRRRALIGFGFTAALLLFVWLIGWLFRDAAGETGGPFTGSLAVTLGALAVYALLTLGLWGGRRRLRAAAFALLAVCVPAELLANAMATLRFLDEELYFESRAAYAQYTERLEEMREALTETEDGTFFRVENERARNANDGLAGGYPAVSHYSSLSRRATFRFLKNAGMTCSSGDKFLRYGGATTALDALLGVRYVFSENGRRAGYAPVGETAGTLGLYRNEYALPLVYWSDAAVLTLPEQAESPFALQNRWIASLLGEAEAAVYQPLTVEDDCMNGVLERQGAYTLVKTEESGTGALLRLNIDNPRRQHVLLYLDSNLPETAAVYVGMDRLNPAGERLVHGVIDLGEQPAGRVTVEISAGDGVWFKTPFAAAFDEEAFGAAVDRLYAGAPSALSVRDEVTGPLVRATVTAPRDGALFTSIPADPGWTVWVDGKEVRPVSVAGAFLAVPLTEGEHAVTLRFCPRGLEAGIALSAGTGALCLALWAARRPRRSGRKTKG